MEKNLRNLFYLAWLCTLALWPSSLKAECPITATGLCTPGVEETIVIDEVETIEYEADGYTVTTDTTTTTTTITTTNENSLDILDGDNDYVTSKFEGDMDLDWGGQGPANMPSGNSCYNLGADKCAQITGSGNSTSTMGVSGMGTTFINTVDISDLDIQNGGRTNYSIKVDKRDSQDRIYMHITGKDGNTSVFSGTDILSESGVNSGYQTYESGFDFAGTITKLIIEVGGRDINLAIGPLFDDIQINVLYNVVSTIVTEHILSVEMWVAYGGSTETEVIDIVENIFEHNDVIEDATDEMYFEPEFDEPDMEMSYETVEMEMEFEMDFEMPDINMDEMEVAVIDIEMEMEMEFEIEMDMEMPDLEMPEPEMEPEPMPEPEMEEPESQPEMEEVKDEPIEEPTEEPQEDVAEEPENEESVSEVETDEEQPEDMEEAEDKGETEEKPVKKQEQKEKAAKKIVKKMGDKGRYDSTNQLKTLIVMQVLGNTRTFFDSQKKLNDREGFFTDTMIPDTKIQNNNIAQYYLFAGSEGLINEMIDSQWSKN